MSSARLRNANDTCLRMRGAICILPPFPGEKYRSLIPAGMARNDHSPNEPAEALSRNRGLISVARIVTFHLEMSGMRLSSRIAIEYGSSPVQQPALQMRSLLSPPRRLRIRSGSIRPVRTSKLCFSRKKYVSPTVRWQARVSISGRVRGLARSRWTYAGRSCSPFSRAADAMPRARSPQRSGGK